MGFLILALILGGRYAENTFISHGIKNYKVAIERPSIGYTLKSKENDNVTYLSNHNAFTSVSLGTKYFDIGISVESEGDAKESIFEKTEVFDLQLVGVYNQKILWDIFYQNYQGLYVLDFDDAETFLNFYTANAYQYGVSLKYFSKDGYEVKKSLGHFSKEKATDWSWVHGINIFQSSLSSSSGLVASNSNDNFSEISSLREIRLSSFGYNFGISGMYAWESFYLSGLLSLGTQAQHQSLHGLDEERWITAVATSFVTDIGYRSDNKSYGLQIKFDLVEIPVKDVSFSQSRATAGFYFNRYF